MRSGKWKAAASDIMVKLTIDNIIMKIMPAVSVLSISQIFESNILLYTRPRKQARNGRDQVKKLT